MSKLVFDNLSQILNIGREKSKKVRIESVSQVIACWQHESVHSTLRIKISRVEFTQAKKYMISPFLLISSSSYLSLKCFAYTKLNAINIRTAFHFSWEVEKYSDKENKFVYSLSNPLDDANLPTHLIWDIWRLRSPTVNFWTVSYRNNSVMKENE